MAHPRKRAVSIVPGLGGGNGEVHIVWMSSLCGWCITFDCKNCMPELLFEKKLYMCGCKSVQCAGNHVPSMGVESESTPVVLTTTEDEEEEPEL